MIRALAVAVLAAILTAAVLFGQDRSTYEALTVDNTAGGVAITTTILRPSGGPQMNYCEGRLETASVRFTDDGSAPTTTAGTLLEVGDIWVSYNHAKSRQARFIRTGGTSGTLHVRCYERGPR